ncbi:hypothetical protein [Photobacterium chitinilyticum]|uniref:Lipoprotein n=1 Tax=Photobacterium chitinilyticum TaxID=2485123 RepID=A0A444JIF6_9GAMM|nr:hypothetical protein [Photobacterium chitinilyticum]RWX52860.1 hypothetical protein EDI28_25060 [Photobacterium chitinilyticum]
MKKLFILPILTSALMGCAGQSQDQHTYIENLNNNIVRGDPQKSIGALHWVIKSDDKSTIEQKITLYFDSLLSEQKFDLCHENKQHQVVTKKVENTKNGDVTVFKETQEADCTTKLTVHSVDNKKVYYDLDLKRLKGYYVEQSFGELSYLPDIHHTITPSVIHYRSNFNEEAFMNEAVLKDAIYFTFDEKQQ